ncbi:MAG: outer membrane protein assembly factor BamD [Bacteroidetes bacterium]|nr:outer membrane protein assembly factor BamD [Bacteroidota bacterium]MBS1629358.1 outer membrane protein assembly factor BamD [Bacteroidota bacterium]
MRALRQVSLFLLIPLLLSLASCSGYEQVRKSSDVNLKLTKANEYYDKHQYQRANELYQDLMPVLRGTRNYEQLFYRYAYTFYYLKDNGSAALYFKNFNNYFPNSPDAEETEFMYAKCLVNMSPKSSLDQSNTLKAMEALQSFINTHPQSKRLAEANTYMDELRGKLEKKDADAARLYYDIGQYHAASVAFENVINQYPESNRSDYYQFMVLKSLMEYANSSVTEKQSERYSNAVAAYNALRNQYPKSTYIPEGEHIVARAQNILNK